MLYAIALDDPAARTANRSEELRLTAWDEDAQCLGGTTWVAVGGPSFSTVSGEAMVGGVDVHTAKSS